MKSGEGPIWFTRMPSEGDEDTHSNKYLYCRMAHSGRSRWTESNTDGTGGQRRCCFCLADTQRVGCVHGACPKNQSNIYVAPETHTQPEAALQKGQDQPVGRRGSGSFDNIPKTLDFLFQK
ncbi:hypothetical protein GGI23_004707 [Coemansia sp. RSA 2559]|nr:hypothetical protein GGI23_004707 [Coemansia sp. RSA 2559]